MARLRRKYHEEIVPELMKRFEYSNINQVPKLEKIIVNMGLGDAIQNIKIIDSAMKELEQITGQKAVVTRARRSIASFKLRKGMPIGCMVTLRRDRMFEFYDRLVNIALARVRDFRGISPKGFDGRGNFSLGLTEQIIFPEIDYDKVEQIRGFSVQIVTTARTDEESKSLLQLLGMPFRKNS